MPHDQKALVEKLRDLTLVLLDDSRPAYSLRNEVLGLKSIFEAAGGLKIDSAESIASGETVTTVGVAISPTMAAMCVDDFARTVQFLRGAHFGPVWKRSLKSRSRDICIIRRLRL